LACTTTSPALPQAEEIHFLKVVVVVGTSRDRVGGGGGGIVLQQSIDDGLGVLLT